MKIALCLSGQPRYIDVTYPYLKQNILDKNDCDVFFHAWFDKNGKYDCAKWNNPQDIDNHIPDKLLSLYNPKNCIIEPNKNEQFKEESKNLPRNTDAEPYIIKSMFYSIKKSYDVMEEYCGISNKKYDMVVRLRFDAAVLTPVNFNCFVDPGQIIYYSDVIRNKFVLCDWFFFSSLQNKKLMMNIYDNIQKYSNLGILVCGEEMLNYHLNYNRCYKCPLKFSTLLVRDDEFKDKSWGQIF